MYFLKYGNQCSIRSRHSAFVILLSIFPPQGLEQTVWRHFNHQRNRGGICEAGRRAGIMNVSCAVVYYCDAAALISAAASAFMTS
jgi:hypothetical protein